MNFNDGPSTIDYSICNENLYEFTDDFLVLPMNELSDHSKIVTLLSKKIAPKGDFASDNYDWKSRGKLYHWDNKRKREFFTALKNSTLLREDINQRLDAGLVHSTGKLIQELFIGAAKSALRVKSQNVKQNWKKRKKTKKWFDSDCIKLKKEVRKSAMLKHTSPHDVSLRLKYHEKLREFKKTCRSKRYFFIEDSLSDIENSLSDSKGFWNKWKSFSEIDGDKSSIDIPGEQLFSYYSQLHEETRESDQETVRVAPIPNRITNLDCLNSPFSKKEFKIVIESLKNCKAEGYDGISNEMLRNAPEEILDLIYKFMNICLEKSLVPNTWTNELITLIHKKGNTSDLGNYRGICVSSALLKVLCTLLNNRIYTMCQENGLISKNQIGFQKQCRTSDHILTLKSVVKKYVTLGEKKLYACFVDLEKAFDSVWHKGLFCKLESNGITGKSLDLIKDLYNKTKCAIKIDNRITDFFSYTKGVRQGCPLSPLLFNIYVNDLIDVINQNSPSDIHLNKNNKINTLMYADDLVLISESKEGLQLQIDSLVEYCRKWKLKVNAKKTKCMIFNRGNKPLKSDFYVDGNKIECVKTFTYLGFSIAAKNCGFQPTIDDLSIKAKRAVFAIKGKFKLSQMPIKLALKMFSSQITPILLYGSEVWSPCMDHNFETWDRSKIEMVYTQFLKQILGCGFRTSNNMVRAETGCRPLISLVMGRHLLYLKSLQMRTTHLCYDALIFEEENVENPNFLKFRETFNLSRAELDENVKEKISGTCRGKFDNYWEEQIKLSGKAISYVKIKTSICLENYLSMKFNLKHKIALTRFRLSNHQLMIEKGRYRKNKIDRDMRFCFVCKNQIEDETHFILRCSLYSPGRRVLEDACRETCVRYDQLNEEQKFVFIMTNENEKVIKILSKFIFENLNLRNKMIEYFFL